MMLLFHTLMLSPSSITMPHWFGDNMVLQTNAEYGARAFLVGKAAPSEKVLVKFGEQSIPVIADATTGMFEVQVRPGGNTNLTITVSGESGPPVVAKHVSGGDVFFCSGQSNMVFPLKLAFNATAEASTLIDFPQFRFFMTQRDYAATPQFDLRPPGAKGAACDSNPSGVNSCNAWYTANEATASGLINDFSAVCFMTVRDIAKLHNLGKRPVGLVQSAWGGTRVEAWMSTDAISAAAKRASGIMPPIRTAQNNVSVLYNAMVAPFNKMAVRAALWYQGEANADQKLTNASKAKGGSLTQYYSAYLQEMIASWRDLKGMGDFAFMTMQLPPSCVSGTSSAKQMTTGRMEVRIAEQESAAHSGGRTDISGAAVTIDLGGKSAWGADHPPNKNEMSRRLALQTVHAAYAAQGRIGSGTAEESLWTGPILSSITKGTTADAVGEVLLSFTNWSATGLTLHDVHAKNIDGTDNSCKLCCAGAAPFEVQVGKNWVMVSMANTLVDAATSTVTLKGASGDVTAVRYAWRDYVECTLINNDSLPLSPFVENIVASAALVTTTAAASAPAVRIIGAGKQMTPPMGFNSWNFYHCNIDEITVRGVIDAIASNGMKEAGYEFVNIDDCWQVERFANNTIQPDPVRFPSGMKALADYAHSKGLKFGVYTARGSRTCQNRPGAYAHEAIDAATYCEWGLDYLKNDNCGGTNWPSENTSWINFQKGFDECYAKTGRYIVKSIEYCRDPTQCGQWIGGVANTWRTVGDVQSTWSSVMGNIHANNKMASVVNNGQAVANGQGNFNDADMLEIGNVGLSFIEQQTMMALWSLAASPLLAGTDIIHASKETISILANAEVTAINQDLGFNGKIQGVLVNSTVAGVEVWAKQLHGGKGVAVVLLNLGDTAAPVTAEWADLGIPAGAKVTVRDLWKKSDAPDATGSLTAMTPAHGTKMFKLTTAAGIHDNGF
jgi:hypothetical protein